MIRASFVKKSEGKNWSWYESPRVFKVEYRVLEEENLSIFIREQHTNLLLEMAMSGTLDDIFDFYGEDHLTYTEGEYENSGFLLNTKKSVPEVLDFIDESIYLRITKIQKDINDFPDELWYFPERKIEVAE